MSGVNKVILIGRLGADPEQRALASGTSVTNLRVATSETWKDKETGEKQERTEWHQVSLFGRLAEIAAEYLVKGSMVYVEGKLNTRKWQDKEGNDRYSTGIIAENLQFLTPKGGNTAGGSATTTSAQKSKPAQKTRPDIDEDEFDDDIPF